MDDALRHGRHPLFRTVDLDRAIPLDDDALVGVVGGVEGGGTLLDLQMMLGVPDLCDDDHARGVAAQLRDDDFRVVAWRRVACEADGLAVFDFGVAGALHGLDGIALPIALTILSDDVAPVQRAAGAALLSAAR